MFTGFSVVPLRFASLVGLAMASAGFLLALFFAVSWMIGGVFSRHGIPPGWASLIVSLTFFAGIQLCVLGMLGEYLGRVFLTQNQAPQFVVRETHGIAPPDRT
jgi:undecaprenyl-phosphate 4-deoxy-4-formamido-L-arabinose transferase